MLVVNVLLLVGHSISAQARESSMHGAASMWWEATAIATETSDRILFEPLSRVIETLLRSTLQDRVMNDNKL